MGKRKIWPRKPFPLGATYDEKGTNFSTFSEVDKRVKLCPFDESGNQICVNLPEVLILREIAAFDGKASPEGVIF